MPKNNRNYLGELAAYNQKNGITATFSEMKKTARRIEKLDAERAEPIDLNAYFLDYQDPTGEEAAENVDGEREHHASVRRRLAVAA
ncbi:hypothetical protein [Pseudarthrobacter sp. NIBRBAC000502770]|uniref:hypothetical protein n=1 Tax=Pseudarthrobacter sp. NIBRBAC000502770 TaxID=2590785 RepID=UPI00113FF80F|nr:hypothetical protein [Pseudarthrobacter sp. NIBRBAC000502770]QDG87153.1 hypothetical protein NIBR502770_00550 [Pseudarthrobacter sp. NIBRBAC000502770]